MIFHEFGDKKFPHILLIHGGGNSWWNYLRQARILSDKYHVILPTLNGHGEEYQKEYISTENSAQQIMDYIKNNCDGKLFAVGGVSLGGQIAIELLSLNSDIAQKAIIRRQPISKTTMGDGAFLIHSLFYSIKWNFFSICITSIFKLPSMHFNHKNPFISAEIVKNLLLVIFLPCIVNIPFPEKITFTTIFS